MDIYREEILEHWRSPNNFGKMPKADVVIDQINPLCGDQVRFFFKFSGPAPLYPRPTSSLSINLNSETQNSPAAAAARRGPPWRVIREDLIIEDVSFTGNGCAVSMASASILSTLIKGKSIKYLSKIKAGDVLDLLGGPHRRRGYGGQAVIPPARLKCAFLPLEAIKKLVNDKHSDVRNQ